MCSMRLITQPNRWSCLPTAFSMAFGIDLQYMIDKIGHDGSEILWPDLPEPACRQGFSTQECIKIGLGLGLPVTPIAKRFGHGPNQLRAHWIDDDMFFYSRLNQHIAVLIGDGEVTRHAVAWDRHRVFDPKGREYDLRDCNINLFTPDTAFLISKSFLETSEIKSMAERLLPERKSNAV